MVGLTSQQKYLSLPVVQNVRKAIDDVCFPLHNHFRQIGNKAEQQKEAQMYKDIINKIGSSKLRLKGNKLYYIPKEAAPMTEVKDRAGNKQLKFDDELGDLKKRDAPEEGPAEYEKEYLALKTEEQLWPLSEKFLITKVMGLRFQSQFPLLSLRNYFGSKIALYFYFLSFFINRLLIIGIVGMLMSMAYFTFDILAKVVFPNETNNLSYEVQDYLILAQDAVTWAFSIYVFIWGFRFTRDWEVLEKAFQINNGDLSENKGNLKDSERSKIREYFYERSLVTDELNTKTKSQSVVNVRFALAVGVTLLMVAVSVGLSMSILEIKRVFIDLIDYEEDILYLPFDIGRALTAANLIEIIKISLLDWGFFHLNLFMVKKIDPIWKSEFEKQFIVLNFIFTIFNHFGVIFLIRFYLPLRYGSCNIKAQDKILAILCDELSQTTAGVDCTGDVPLENDTNALNLLNLGFGCASEIKDYFGTYVIVNLVISLGRMFYVKIHTNKIKKKKTQLDKQFRKFYKKKSTYFETMKSLRSKKTFDKSQALGFSTFSKKQEANVVSNQVSVHINQSVPVEERLDEIRREDFETRGDEPVELLSKVDNPGRDFEQSEQVLRNDAASRAKSSE